MDVFAGVPEIIAVLVAKDLDEPDGNMNGRLLISSSSAGEITETCEDTNVATALTVTNGIASFCYSPLTSMGNGQIGSLLFTVIDGDDFSDGGSITFKGNIPIVLAPESPIKVGLEDSALIFSLGDDVFGRRAKSTFDEVPIGIRITKLPNPSLGILFDEFHISFEETNALVKELEQILLEDSSVDDSNVEIQLKASFILQIFSLTFTDSLPGRKPMEIRCVSLHL